MKPINARYWHKARHDHRAERCPHLGVKRTWRFQSVISAYDPKRTSRQATLRAISPSAISWPARTIGELPQGYVLGPREGEHLVLRGGDIFIKVDPIGGSRGLAMGTQQILVGTGIPIHRHLEMDEAFYVIEGSGVLF